MVCYYSTIKTTIRTATTTSITAITTAAITYGALSVSQFVRHLTCIISVFFFTITDQDDRAQQDDGMRAEKLNNMAEVTKVIGCSGI